MRYMIAVVLCCLLAFIHLQLWWGEGSSYARAQVLTEELEGIKAQNEHIRLLNAELSAELRDLRDGTEILEEHARSELGMVKPNEVLIIYR